MPSFDTYVTLKLLDGTFCCCQDDQIDTLLPFVRVGHTLGMSILDQHIAGVHDTYASVTHSHHHTHPDLFIKNPRKIETPDKKNNNKKQMLLYLAQGS